MKILCLRLVLAAFLIVPAAGLICSARADGDQVMIDGAPGVIELQDLPENSSPLPDGRTVDIVGGTNNPGTGTGRAKGGSYQVDVSVVLNEAEFYLNFTSTQTLTFYVFSSPVEFGLYTEVYRGSATVAGTGQGWYSSGPLVVPLSAGMHYIIAVSWNGTLTYYYNTGDSQATSFGAYTHGYATGYDPLPTSFQSTVNDQAIYYQRLTTDETPVPVDPSTWGRIKALY